VDPYPENVQGEEEPLQECFEPFIGMELDSVDACYKFYNLYGLKAEFGIRKAQKYHSQTGEKKLISQRFVCCKEGLSWNDDIREGVLGYVGYVATQETD
jgi:hypothetical protein